MTQRFTYTNCAPLLADLFLNSMTFEAEFVQELLRKVEKKLVVL